MKTLKKKIDTGFEYKRVTDNESEKYISLGWSYCPKTEWKVNVRDFGKVKEDSSSSEDKYKKNKKNPKNNEKNTEV